MDGEEIEIQNKPNKYEFRYAHKYRFEVQDKQWLLLIISHQLQLTGRPSCLSASEIGG